MGFSHLPVSATAMSTTTMAATDLLLLLVVSGPPSTDDSEPAHMITVDWRREWDHEDIAIIRHEKLEAFAGHFDDPNDFEEMVAQQV
ncbi:hypothetical protein DL96DRAFT_1586105 [Flagelloscypha sp. PMI_526]|nr:hypothetical protein DL96DRAFT_1586105 [Flagelloscypha sp. PMI_526]